MEQKRSRSSYWASTHSLGFPGTQHMPRGPALRNKGVDVRSWPNADIRARIVLAPSSSAHMPGQNAKPHDEFAGLHRIATCRGIVFVTLPWRMPACRYRIQGGAVGWVHR